MVTIAPRTVSADTFTFDSFGTMPARGFPIVGEPSGIINFIVGQTPVYEG